MADKDRVSIWRLVGTIVVGFMIIASFLQSERRSEVVIADKKRAGTWRLVGAVLVGLVFIAFFSWSEQGAGLFHWWHVYALVGALIVAVLVKLIPGIGRILTRVTEHIGFEKESARAGGGVRRDYFMALVPMYFIVSAYLMQAALRGGELDMEVMILSIVVLVFALYLVFASFLRALPEAWAHTTYQVASWGAIIGALVFAINLLTVTGDLAKSGASAWYVNTFLYAGFLVVFGIMLFHLISVSGRNWK